MTEVISVRFRGGCKAYFFDPQGVTVHEGDDVIVETAQGSEFGTCVCGNHSVEDHAVIQPLRPMHRIATDEDRKTLERNHKREQDAFAVCEKKIAAHKLEMKLVNVECSFDGNKIIFFFTADGRVDFRELVKDLAGVFHSRIELRQIGVRDEAKMLGGVGSCGRGLCCATWLSDFQPVSIKMAKVQNLSLNPAKISGVCGRLMCCLKYENDVYSELRKGMPDVNERIETPEGLGKVVESDVLTGKIRVRIYTGEKDDTGADKLSADVYTYKKDEIGRFDKKDRKPQNGGNSGAHGKGHDRPGKNHPEHSAPRNGAGGEKTFGNGKGGTRENGETAEPEKKKSGNRRRRRRKNRKNDGRVNPQESGGGVRGTGNDRETFAEN